MANDSPRSFTLTIASNGEELLSVTVLKKDFSFELDQSSYLQKEPLHDLQEVLFEGLRVCLEEAQGSGAGVEDEAAAGKA